MQAISIFGEKIKGWSLINSIYEFYLYYILKRVSLYIR